jgi:hypothetical protein
VTLGLGMVFLPFAIPALSRLLGIVQLSPMQWLLIIGIAMCLLSTVEIGKAISNRLSKSR